MEKKTSVSIMCKANTSYQDRLRINKNKRLLREYGRVIYFLIKKFRLSPQY